MNPEPRRAWSWVAVAVLVAGAVIGSNAFSVRNRLLGSALPDRVHPVTSRSPGAVSAGDRPPTTALRSTPWWQTVRIFEGTGSRTLDAITIRDDAINWRVTWSCESGRIAVLAERQPRPIVDADCPEGMGVGAGTGTTRLEVSAGGAWRLEVAQRIDIPLVEPPLDSMVAAGTTVLAAGSFSKADRVAAGSITIFEAADGVVVRLRDFWVTPRASLQLRLSAAESPGSTEDYLAAESQFLAELDVTAGTLNYEAPAGVDPTGFRSVVIWSPADTSVYATADLEAFP